MTSPAISVVMAAYNAERFIAEAIESVRSQTRGDWELIILDDASSDQTAAIAQTFSSGDERIHLRRLQRLGSPARVRNAGISLARGELITFLDADDCLPPTALAEVSAPLDQDPALIAAYGFVACLDLDGRPTQGPGFRLRRNSQGEYALPKGYAHSWKRVALGQVESSVAIMVRADTLRALGGFCESLGAAEDLALRYALFLQKFDGIRAIPCVAYHYRLNPQSLTRQKPNADALLRNHLDAQDVLLNQPQTPAEVHLLASQALAKRYRYAASVILSQGHAGLARQTALKVFRDRRVHPLHAFKAFVPLALRSLLPGRWERAMKTLAIRLRDGAR
ncbi:MAG: glycosyltransferase family 2 protein [Vampirovibrionales bacterium]|nr:glycosyltransferase family 2 protein [Vampirovibrionales bacterium]